MLKKNLGVTIGILAFVLLVTLSALVSSNVDSKDQNEKGLKEITVSEYIARVQSGNRSVFYIGTPRCGYCTMIEPVLRDLSKDLDIEIYYINMDNVAQEDYAALFGSSDVFETNWGTPLLIIFEHGLTVDYNIGYAEYDVLKDLIN
jgi:predicted bacteriocin transport accessory protein